MKTNIWTMNGEKKVAEAYQIDMKKFYKMSDSERVGMAEEIYLDCYRNGTEPYEVYFVDTKRPVKKDGDVYYRAVNPMVTIMESVDAVTNHNYEAWRDGLKARA